MSMTGSQNDSCDTAIQEHMSKDIHTRIARYSAQRMSGPGSAVVLQPQDRPERKKLVAGEDGLCCTHQEPSHGRFVLRRRLGLGARERHPPRPRRPQMMPRTFALAVPQHAITRSIIKSQTRIRSLAAWREPAAPKPRPCQTQVKPRVRHGAKYTASHKARCHSYSRVLSGLLQF